MANLAPAALWQHFAPLAPAGTAMRRRMVEGHGTKLYDIEGHEYLDMLSSLYCVNIGHGRREIGEAMRRQADSLAFYPTWGSAPAVTIELAERIRDLAPRGFERVFFTSGGSDSIDSAWKLVRQYHRLRGKPAKYGVIARRNAYHGTSLGALSITGVDSLKATFAPLLDGVSHVPSVDGAELAADPEAFFLARANAFEQEILRRGADTIGALVVEPVQNSGGCLTAPPAYFRRLREIADAHDILLVSDETICAWGRLGTWFGADAVGFEPDIITTAKGLTSAYAPMGAVLVNARASEPFLDPEVYFNHGITFGGHPVAAAAALANIDYISEHGLIEHVAGTAGPLFRRELEELTAHPLVHSVRGTGLFQALVLSAPDGTALSPDQLRHLARHVPRALLEAGVICRALHRGAPVIQFAPPLTVEPEEMAETRARVSSVLTDALELLDAHH